MSKVEIKPETVVCYNTDFVRGVKHTDNFDGNNMWILEVLDGNGDWFSTQTLHVDIMERILDRPEPLTRYVGF